MKKTIGLIVFLIIAGALITASLQKTGEVKKSDASNEDYTIAYVLKYGTSILITNPDGLVDENGNIVAGFVQPDGSVIGKTYTVEEYLNITNQPENTLKKK